MSLKEADLTGHFETKEQCITQEVRSQTKNDNTVTMTVQKKVQSSEKNIVTVEKRSVKSCSMNELLQDEELSKMFKEMTTSSSFKTSQVQTVKSNISMKLGADGISSVEHFPMTSIDKYTRQQSTPEEIESAKNLYKERLLSEIEALNGEENPQELLSTINRITEIVYNAWEVPSNGHLLGSLACYILRTSGVLEFLIQSLDHPRLQEASALLLQNCLNPENIDFVSQNGLDVVVRTACSFIKKSKNTELWRIGTGIIEHLLKHDQGTCSEVVRLGGLESIIYSCSKSDKEILLHCAAALANLSICGGAENHEALVKANAPMWLVPLVHHEDPIIKYYSLLAFVVLYSQNNNIDHSKEILCQVEPFITAYSPEKIVELDSTHAHGQSKHWLQRLARLLDSVIEETQMLVSFHFCVEAIIKRTRGESLIREMNLILQLKNVISGPNRTAAKYATEALWLVH